MPKQMPILRVYQSNVGIYLSWDFAVTLGTHFNGEFHRIVGIVCIVVA